MTIPAGYTPLPFGGVAKQDSSSPFGVGVATVSGTYSQLSSGLWWNMEDNSGPYFYDRATATAIPCDLFRGAT